MILRRFQKPALGPLMTNANVQRERPRRESGRYSAAVRREASDVINVMNSNNFTTLLPLLSHLYGRSDRIALGKTYNAISPLLRPFSIQILLPHSSEPANMAPQGPSQTSCEIHGNSRAKKIERVKQTPNQHEETNADRNAALLKVCRIVGKTTRCRRRMDLGRVRMMGTK